jgi:hypothetical protein
VDVHDKLTAGPIRVDTGISGWVLSWDLSDMIPMNLPPPIRQRNSIRGVDDRLLIALEFKVVKRVARSYDIAEIITRAEDTE